MGNIKFSVEQLDDGTWLYEDTAGNKIYKAEEVGDLIKVVTDIILFNTESTENSEG
jgi:hypothetical protein